MVLSSKKMSPTERVPSIQYKLYVFSRLFLSLVNIAMKYIEPSTVKSIRNIPIYTNYSFDSFMKNDPIIKH